MPELTELQKTQVAYSYFTFEEWQLLASCVSLYRAETMGTGHAASEEAMREMLTKFPSAVL